MVVSKFEGGQFKQTLTGNRVKQQENPKEGTASTTFTTSNSKPDPKDPYATGGA
jgi:hypothetical protein